MSAEECKIATKDKMAEGRQGRNNLSALYKMINDEVWLSAFKKNYVEISTFLDFSMLISFPSPILHKI